MILRHPEFVAGRRRKLVDWVICTAEGMHGRPPSPGMAESLVSTPTSKGVEVFRILVVDDDPGFVHLLRELMKDVRRRHELHPVKDGVEALQFLHAPKSHAAAPQPDLVLLDINMPRLGGLEVLSAIKSDPELCAIPVIVVSTSSAPHDVRQSYWAKANCYVQKPANLEEYERLVHAIGAFWVELALIPSREERMPASKLTDYKRELAGKPALHIGPMHAVEGPEAISRALRDSQPKNTPRRSGCEEYNYLLDRLGEAVKGLIELHEQQYRAVAEGDSDCHRFDLLIHMANEKKQLAKYTCLRHLDEHGCSKWNAIDHPRT